MPIPTAEILLPCVDQVCRPIGYAYLGICLLFEQPYVHHELTTSVNSGRLAY